MHSDIRHLSASRRGATLQPRAMKRIRLYALKQSTVGHTAIGLWRHPDSQAARYTDLDYWTAARAVPAGPVEDRTRYAARVRRIRRDPARDRLTDRQRRLQ
jgi:hypothetical protein